MNKDIMKVRSGSFSLRWIQHLKKEPYGQKKEKNTNQTKFNQCFFSFKLVYKIIVYEL